MSKMGGLGGGGGGMTRPMPNPRLNPPTGAPPAPAAKPGLFANMPIQKRFDMAMDLLKNGMQMGAESGSPLMAFLSPLAGAAIGGGIENKRAKLMDEQNDELMAAMMPGANSEEVQRLSDIVNNPDTPDYLKSIAKAKLDAAIAPYTAKPGGGGGGGGGGRKASGRADTGKSKNGEALFDSYIGEDGIIRGRTRDGRMLPYVDENGEPMKAKGADASSPATAPIILNGWTIEEIEEVD